MKTTFALLKATRKRQHIPVLRIAEEFGYSHTTIYRYEKNEFNSIDTEMLCNIAVFINVPIQSLLTALKQDGYTDEFLQGVLDKYRERSGDKMEELDLDDFDDLNFEHMQSRDDMLPTTMPNKAALIDYVSEYLDDDQSKKALDVLRVMFSK